MGEIEHLCYYPNILRSQNLNVDDQLPVGGAVTCYINADYAVIIDLISEFSDFLIDTLCRYPK